jgi:hypothetical protein
MMLQFYVGVRNSIIYEMHGNAAFLMVAKELVGIIKCPRAFNDNTCAGDNHKLWTKPADKTTRRF